MFLYRPRTMISDGKAGLPVTRTVSFMTKALTKEALLLPRSGYP